MTTAQVRWSNKKKDNGRVQITDVNGLHVTSLVLLQHNGSVEEISRASFPISELLLFLTSKGGRNQILRQPSLATITTAVGKYVNSDDFEGIPPIDSASMLAQFRAYTTNDAATENCSDILKT
eukprot:scaffold31711_cov168-Skeletonema_marinoi.AAC.1